MPSRPTKYESLKAKQHRGKHLGGPGKPDYARGPKLGEVKDRETPVTGPELIRLADQGVDEIDSKGGFTRPAIKTARELGIKLFSKNKRLV